MSKGRTAILLCAATMMLLGATAARAQSCSDEIARLAQQYNLASGGVRTGATDEADSRPAPPATAESRGLTGTQSLAQSPGVVTPPDTGAPVAPVPPSGSRVQTQFSQYAIMAAIRRAAKKLRASLS